MPTIMVDSMQVYKEIPTITNQARARHAELVGIVSVAEEWTVALHKERAQAVIEALPEGVPFVLDAGTGMYLNALVLDVSLAPKVPASIRTEAERLVKGSENLRREARKQELELAGIPEEAPERGSIWDGDLRYDTDFVYLRPAREDLDVDILIRSSKIVREGAEEAKRLLESGIEPNPSVRQAIGVKEMLLHVSGGLSSEEAEKAITTRTRRLARRQIRWFDKLVRCLPDNTRVFVVQNPTKVKRIMHDILGA